MMMEWRKLLYLPFGLVGLSFLVMGTLGNVVQLFLVLAVKPVSPWVYRKLNQYVIYFIWGHLLFLAEWWSGSTLTFHTDDDTWNKLGTEHALVVLNHSYEVDWLMTWVMTEQSRLFGNSKSFVKKALGYAPPVGVTALLGESIFVDRNWEKDKPMLEKSLVNLTEYTDPIWLVLFAEGTRFTPAKHAASVEFATKAGIAPLKHLLIPRTKGFLAAVEKLRGKFALYCITMAFNTKDGVHPSLKNMVLGRNVVADVLLRKIPLEDIPVDPEQASEWLQECFRFKDQMLDEYKTTGMFPKSLPGNRYLKGPIRGHFRPRRLWSLLVVAASCWATLPPAFRGVCVLLQSGAVNISIAVVFLVLVGVALRKLIELSSASKGSAYGSKTQ